jgi:hypothetical protein
MEKAKNYIVPLAALAGGLLLGYGLYKSFKGKKVDPIELTGDDLLNYNLIEDLKKLGTV